VFPFSSYLQGELISEWGLRLELMCCTLIRLVVIAVLALCIGHRGFVFGRDSGHAYRGVSTAEVK
jgi:hypothetical protein